MSARKKHITEDMRKVLEVINEHGPISKRDISAKAKICLQSVDRAIRRTRKSIKCIRVCDYKPNPLRPGTRYTVALYEFSCEPDVPKVYVERKKKRLSQVIVRRDPFTAQFFGDAS